ncbi:hypothetical protein B0T22DRAFT_471760, partial [Podospora appendiculata]
MLIFVLVFFLLNILVLKYCTSISLASSLGRLSDAYCVFVSFSPFIGIACIGRRKIGPDWGSIKNRLLLGGFSFALSVVGMWYSACLLALIFFAVPSGQDGLVTRPRKHFAVKELGSHFIFFAPYRGKHGIACHLFTI